MSAPGGQCYPAAVANEPMKKMVIKHIRCPTVEQNPRTRVQAARVLRHRLR